MLSTMHFLYIVWSDSKLAHDFKPFSRGVLWQLEKVRTLLSRAKYGCASVSNPVNALQRDSDVNSDSSYDDASVRAMYSDQLSQLENLIARQHVCQQQMRDQLVAVEKQYHSVMGTFCSRRLTTLISAR